MKQNAQLLLDHKLKELSETQQFPKLLLHACCAPCSSYVLEYLTAHFDITLFFYNPNIAPAAEYEFRVQELRRLITQMPLARPVKLLEGRYDPSEFFDISRGLERIPEGGERCFQCYRLRLEETARTAAENGFEYFTTTLSISPYKNADKLNEIGGILAEAYGVPYLFSDFKKRNGYRRSCQLSADYQLYRQDYCGCVFSKAEAEKRRNTKKESEI